jgi:hypothetical protein
MGDKVYLLDPDSITSREYKQIKAATGLSINKFWQTISAFGEDVDAEILDVLHWLFLKRSGEADLLDNVPDYVVADFLLSFVESNSDNDAEKDADTEDLGKGSDVAQ